MMWVRRMMILGLVMMINATLAYSATAANRVKSVTSVSVGSYQESDGVDSVYGTQFSIAYKYFFSDQWAYFAGLDSGSATGEHTISSGAAVGIRSDKTAVNGGVMWHYLIDQKPALTPYLGGGITLRRYRYDFDYPDSPIGVTSGLGYGPVLSTGMKIEISDHFLMIPGYQYEQVTIKTEGDENRALVSSGFLLALIIRF